MNWSSDIVVVADGPFNSCYGHIANDAVAQSIVDTFIPQVSGFIPGPDAGSFDNTANGRTLLGVVVFDGAQLVLVLEGDSQTINTPITVQITKGLQSETLNTADAQAQVIDGNLYFYWDAIPALLGAELFGTYQLTLAGVNEVVVATAQDIIDRIREIANDNASAFITSVRWTDAELLLWITDAQREIVKTKPEAYPVTELFDVVNDSARQRVDPTLAYRLIRVEANAYSVGESGDTLYGNVIRIVERDVFDSFNPGWTRFVPLEPDETQYFKSYMMDANDPLAFWLWPLSTSLARKVWVTYAGIPATLTDVTDGLSLSDMYIAPIVDYAVYRALCKEAREANREVADRFLRTFYAALGVHRPILMSIGQNATRPPDAAA